MKTIQTTTTCDICRHEIQNNESGELTLTINNAWVHFFKNQNIVYMYKNVDLCPRCFEEIIKTIELLKKGE